MKKLICLLALVPVMAPAAAVADSDEGPLLVRVRGVYISPANKSDAIPSLSVPEDAIHVSDKIIPEVDITYFFAFAKDLPVLNNMAAELILTYPQKHDVELSGTKIGTFKHLPPILSLQYHIIPQGVVRPYVGLGVNLTLISDVNINVPNVGALDLDDSSIGVSGQVGADVKVADGLFVNADVKYVTLRSDVKLDADGTKVSAVKVDPWLLSLGVGYRF